MKIERVPESNKFGLVLPPTEYLLAPLRTESPNDKDWPDLHHLYWPRKLYGKKKSLAKEFGDHSYNKVWLLRSDHDNYHAEYDGVPIPARDVMEVFLEEARTLELLRVSVRAVEMINEAIYEGRVKAAERTGGNKKAHLTRIYETVENFSNLELVPQNIAHLAVSRALQLPECADLAA
jgi:hypothetical protein